MVSVVGSDICVDVPGALVQPDFLRMFSGKNTVAASAGSGRLELAESLLQPEHPLTSRVYVNRVWQWVFGTGLVATPDDFGRLGDKPSNPELLDWLGREFVREGWSTKSLVRRLVLSQTFRQSGLVSQAARERDPGNRITTPRDGWRRKAFAMRCWPFPAGSTRNFMAAPSRRRAASRMTKSASSPARSMDMADVRSTCKCPSWHRRCSSPPSICRTSSCPPAGAM